jgi:hypothetical protein
MAVVTKNAVVIGAGLAGVRIRSPILTPAISSTMGSTS